MDAQPADECRRIEWALRSKRRPNGGKSRAEPGCQPLLCDHQRLDKKDDVINSTMGTKKKQAVLFYLFGTDEGGLVPKPSNWRLVQRQISQIQKRTIQK